MAVTTITSKRGFKKQVVKGGLISIEAEWVKELKVNEFARTHLKKHLAIGLDKVGKLVIDRAKFQASGPRIRRLGMTKWEAIRAYYGAQPLSAPIRVRVFTGKYKRGFLKRVTPHPTLTKASVEVGNKMKYAKFVEFNTDNVFTSMMAVWKPLLFQVGLSVGRAFETWEAKKP